ncbi:aspartate aminotransferase family protein [bacterium]|nr:aspartate aminotransferase family protein [bacterium]
MDESQRLEKENHFQFYKRYPVTFVEGKGTRLKDTNGKEYIDALAGIAVNSIGHCHPNVVKAIQNQAEKLIHITNLYYNEPQSKLALLMTEISGLDRIFFTNSGGEAVEGAIKLARRYAFKKGRKGNIVSMHGCFHGRTLATTAMGKKKYQEGFDPIPGGFLSIPFNDINTLENVVHNDVIAVIIEPVQGEGGIRIANTGYIQKVSEICKENDILLIFDEIQCGMGRTGKMFAFQHFGVIPDILTLAKALGGGFPIGAVIARQEIAEAFDYGIHGTTFGGNPLACAASLATVNTIISENLSDQAQQKGEYLIEKLKDAAKKVSGIKEVRGLGLMIGVELEFNGAEVVNKMMEKGVLANCTEETIIRLVPPLLITKEELNQVFNALILSIEEVQNNG